MTCDLSSLPKNKFTEVTLVDPENHILAKREGIVLKISSTSKKYFITSVLSKHIFFGRETGILQKKFLQYVSDFFSYASYIKFVSNSINFFFLNLSKIFCNLIKKSLEFPF